MDTQWHGSEARWEQGVCVLQLALPPCMSSCLL